VLLYLVAVLSFSIVVSLCCCNPSSWPCTLEIR
jgi:hypothetical protein